MTHAIAAVPDLRSYSPLPRTSAGTTRTAAPCADLELDTILWLLRSMRPRPMSVVIGNSADEVSRANGTRIAEAWAEHGGLVLTTVTWPETAASWLRQARRFAGPEPDAWIVTATPGGWIGMGRRLAYSTSWSARRTVAMRRDLQFGGTALGVLILVYFFVCALSSVPADRLVEQLGSAHDDHGGLGFGGVVAGGHGLGTLLSVPRAGLVVGGVSNALGQLGSNQSLSREARPGG
jgi:hypothetical protein